MDAREVRESEGDTENKIAKNCETEPGINLFMRKLFSIISVRCVILVYNLAKFNSS